VAKRLRASARLDLFGIALRNGLRTSTPLLSELPPTEWAGRDASGSEGGGWPVGDSFYHDVVTVDDFDGDR
jgi:hypothetical protein